MLLPFPLIFEEFKIELTDDVVDSIGLVVLESEDV